MSRRHFVIITLLYWVVAIISFWHYGVKYVNDSERLIEYADILSQGFYFDPHNFWYVGYVLFLLIMRTISTSYLLIIAVQYMVSYLAALSVFQIARLLFNSGRSGLVASVLYILFHELIAWNSYILAESLYVSFICFSLHALLLYNDKPGAFRLIPTVLVVTFTALIKPTGIALIGALAATTIYILVKQFNAVIPKTLAILVIATAFIIITNKMLTTFLIMENYQRGEIIYDLVTLPNANDYGSLLVTPPQNLYVPDEDVQPLLKIVYFIAHHPWYWMKLFFIKLFYFLSHVRPFWSPAHNIFSVLFLVPVYVLAIRTLVKKAVGASHSVFAITFLGIHVLGVCTTSEDWDGRFLIPLLPVLFVLSSYSFSHVLKYIKVRQSPWRS